ncbi:hypothetical protein DFH08DRAFT_980310 [Mycena albidolilacea]|uniref:Uncharacterized protein n=1 Tax=Mycena albidolilacea TaxID=1033008 RepID=A0AAD7AT85_9AGAR|nr:hypothetical protein DFH08DRAFT_980310 [Mycena albidolilacea]
MDALVLCLAGLSFKKNRRDPDDDDDEQAVKKLGAGSPSSPVSVLVFPPHRILPPTPQGPVTITVTYPVVCIQPALSAYRQKELEEWNALCIQARSSESQHAPRPPPVHVVVKELVVAVKPALAAVAQKAIEVWNARCLKSRSHLSEHAPRYGPTTVIIPESREDRHAPEREDLLEAAASSTTDSTSILLKAAHALDAPKSAMGEDKQRVSVFDTIAANVASSRSFGSSTVDGSSRVSPSATMAPDASKGATAEGKQRVSVFDTIAANPASSCNVGSSSVDGLSLISPSAKSAPGAPMSTAAHWRGFLSAFNTAAVNTAFDTGADSGSSVLKDVSNTGARGRHLDKSKGKEIGGHAFDVGVNLGSTVNIGKGFGWAPDRTDDIGGSLSGGSGVRRHKYSGRGKVSRYPCSSTFLLDHVYHKALRRSLALLVFVLFPSPAVGHIPQGRLVYPRTVALRLTTATASTWSACQPYTPRLLLSSAIKETILLDLGTCRARDTPGYEDVVLDWVIAGLENPISSSSRSFFPAADSLALPRLRLPRRTRAVTVFTL